MSTIHGSSHRALKHMRKHPAALSVYWIYISRVNYENVAYPSLRGLSRDTGWSISECHEARKWLVENGALEVVPDYIRPEWRKLESSDKTKINLDKSEYFRPTGFIMIGDKKYSLLYVPRNEISDVEVENPNDESSMYDHNRHRLATDIGSDSTELDSIKDSKLGTNQEELLRNSSARGAKTRNRKPKKENTVPKPELDAMKNHIAALFYESIENLTKSEWARINKVAHELCVAKRTPLDVDVIYKYCKDNFDRFTENALLAHASAALNAHKPKDTHIPDAKPFDPDNLPRVDDYPVYDDSGMYVGMAYELDEHGNRIEGSKT
jgi:hypothetical protein